MRQDIVNLSLLLHLLAGIVQEEINQHGVQLPLGLGMLPFNLLPQQLDAPDTAAADLDLHVLARGELVAPRDPRLQPRRVPQAAQRLQHLRDAVVGEHGERAVVNVRECAVGGAVEAGPQVGDHDLGPFVQLHGLAVEHGRVAEVGE